MLENRKDGIGSIFEGLQRIKNLNEAGSVFSSKMGKALSGQPTGSDKFVREALDIFYKKLDSGSGGYTEMKKVESKSLGDTKLWSWKVQANEAPTESFNGGRDWKPLNRHVFSFTIDGELFECISFELENGDKRLSGSNSLPKGTTFQDFLFIGVSMMHQGRVVSKSLQGITYRVIVLVPDVVSSIVDGEDNKFLKGSDTLENKDFKITYEPFSGKMHAQEKDIDGVTISTTSTSLRGVWNELLDSFGESTGVRELTNLLRKSGVKFDLLKKEY